MRKDWEFYSIKDLGKIVTGSTPSTKNELNYSSNDYSFVKPSDISQSQISYIDETECYVSEYAFQNSRILPSGAVLVTCIGIIGKVGIVVNDCICNQQINAIIPNEKVNNKFLAYSIFSKKEMLALIANAPVVPIINKNDFSNIKLSVPPLQTQQQIVEELDCLTSIIEKQKKQLEELDNLAQSIFYDMFGDPIVNEKGWNVKKLEDIVHKNCTLSYGIVQPMEDVVDGVPIVRPIDLIDTFVSDTNLKRTRKEISNKYKRTILTGYEILLCVRGTTGIVSLVNELFAGYNVTRGIVPILLSSLYNRWFVYYQIKTSSIQQKISELTYGIALRQINIKDLRALTLITPPLSLQQQFASKIEAIEKQKELIKKSIKETEDLFNSRMDYYFN